MMDDAGRGLFEHKIRDEGATGYAHGRLGCGGEFDRKICNEPKAVS